MLQRRSSLLPTGKKKGGNWDVSSGLAFLNSCHKHNPEKEKG
jgi:hypothetical protein